jgi:hypothetical protein
MTIINPHNVGQLYVTWVSLLLFTVVVAGLTYYATMRQLTPLLVTAGTGWWLGFAMYSGMAVVLGSLFRYVFRRPVIAWSWFGSVALVGAVFTLTQSWGITSIAFFSVACGSILLTGPYLHFE